MSHITGILSLEILPIKSYGFSSPIEDALEATPNLALLLETWIPLVYHAPPNNG